MKDRKGASAHWPAMVTAFYYGSSKLTLNIRMTHTTSEIKIGHLFSLQAPIKEYLIYRICKVSVYILSIY